MSPDIIYTTQREFLIKWLPVMGVKRCMVWFGNKSNGERINGWFEKPYNNKGWPSSWLWLKSTWRDKRFVFLGI